MEVCRDPNPYRLGLPRKYGILRESKPFTDELDQRGRPEDGQNHSLVQPVLIMIEVPV